jgi:hypothetical protein
MGWGTEPSPVGVTRAVRRCPDGSDSASACVASWSKAVTCVRRGELGASFP